MTGRLSAPRAPVVPPSSEVLAREALARVRLREQGAAMLAGTPGVAPRSPRVALESLPMVPGVPAPISGSEALKAVGLYRKSVRARPVVSGYTPQRTPRPVIFPYQPGQQLTKLSRTVSREWVEVITSVSTTQMVGGKLSGSQGRNLIRIVQTLRQHCFLNLDKHGRPLQTREQVLEVVDGENYSFARECGMSGATFYRALKHPLAHLFIRTQKVQRTDPGTQARRNVATLFSVALYEPLMPMELELAFWAEQVEQGEEFVVPDYNSQNEWTKRRPLNIQEQIAGCGKLTAKLAGHPEVLSGSEEGRQRFLRWIDGAGLISSAGEAVFADPADTTLDGCIDKIRRLNPELWEFAVHIAIYHDDEETRAVAAVGYYKALVHLGVPTVRHWVQRLERWQLKGQAIHTPGRLLMHHLNKEARSATGFPIRDLGTEKGQHLT